MRPVLLLCFLLFRTLAFSQGIGGVISGEIRGLNGKPARGVRVAVAQVPRDSTQPLNPQAYLHQKTITDSAGRYRLANLAEGRFFLIAGQI
ncbi:MAG TPA: carboxypeptidase-like regulatory domain-containing protein, partial [Terriglobia bacterium]|nr:carboxypeptidase-like regulatory domain-containing protein [Terriglobia bacterium]